MDTAEAFTPAGGPRARFGALLWRVGAIGADPADSRELRDKKTLLVLTTLAVQPAGLMWGGLYWAYGEHLAALIPWSYTPASLLALLVFARTRSFSFMRAAQLTIIIVLPALLMLALGGITPSSGVILWSLLAPVGAVVYDSPRRAWAWFAAFIALLAATVALAPLLRTSPSELPAGLIKAFAVLNIAAPSLVVFALLTAFAIQREQAQGRVESLLLNVLPREIAERLQAAPRAIADHFDDVSILFADVVDFTPLSARMTPTELVGILDRLFSTSTTWPTSTRSRRSRRSATATWSPRASRRRARPRTRARPLALELRECAAHCLPEPRRPAAPHRHRLRPRRRRRDRAPPLPLRPLGRHGQHGEPDGVARHAGRDPDHESDVGARAGRLRVPPRGLVDVKGKGPVETWQLVGRGLAGEAVDRPAL